MVRSLTCPFASYTIPGVRTNMEAEVHVSQTRCVEYWPKNNALPTWERWPNNDFFIVCGVVACAAPQQAHHARRSVTCGSLNKKGVSFVAMLSRNPGEMRSNECCFLQLRACCLPHPSIHQKSNIVYKLMRWPQPRDLPLLSHTYSSGERECGDTMRRRFPRVGTCFPNENN